MNDLAHELQLPRPEVLDFLKSYVPGPRTKHRHGSDPLLVVLAVSSVFATAATMAATTALASVCKHPGMIT